VLVYTLKILTKLVTSGA